jgi:FkbM family methyltransferase
VADDVPAARAVRYRIEGRNVIVLAADDATDSISNSIRHRDPSVFLEFRDVAPYVPPGTSVLDVGAHVGLASAYFRSRGHRVVSFEASPTNAALLRAARNVNGFDRWSIVEAAVSDRAGTLQFVSDGPEGHITGGGEPALKSTAGGTVSSVEAIDLDTWLLRAPEAQPVGFIKMDIEGAELQAIAGAQRLLSGPDAPALFIESNGHCLHWFGETPATLAAALTRLGYHLFGVRSKRPLRPTSFYPIDPQALQGRVCVNYFCVKDVAAFRAQGARISAAPPGSAQLERDVLRTIRSDNPHERTYIARALGDYPDVLAAHPRIRSAWAAMSEANAAAPPPAAR